MNRTKKIFTPVIFTFILIACNLFQPAASPTPPASPSQAAPGPTRLPTETSLPASTEAPTTIPKGKDTADILKEMGGYPCSDNSDFTCVKLVVPLDQINPKPGETIEVVFAVLPATGERKGMFVTAVGGPGGSGVLSADSYTAAFDPSIPQHFDIVFFDQRGVGDSGNLQCAQAAADFYRSDWRATTPAEEAYLLQVAQTFSENCVKEMKNSPLLPYLGTDQAVRDLESFRQAMQDHGSATADKFWLYGESYGTQYAQTYAAAFPQHLAGLILDGTVDLTVSGLDYYKEQAQAFYDVLESTLKACNDDAPCAKDMDGDALAAYDKLSASLSVKPQEFRFPLPTGHVAVRKMTLADLESAATGYEYTEATRLIFLRSLAAAASQNNLAPMARVLYDSLALDPETLQAIPDPSYSDAVYYGVECNDYYYAGDTPQAAAEAYLRAGDAIDKSLPHFASLFYGDIPCPFWPVRTKNPARPAPLIAQGIPTLVLGATADPATPVDQGVRVFSRLADGYLVLEQGGPHVIYGRGVSCVDDLVTAFLVKDQPPAQRKTQCDSSLYDPYVPIAAVDASVYTTTLAAIQAVDNEIQYIPEYYDWDQETTTSVGCSFGGTLTFEATDTGQSFTLQKCAFSKGFTVTGEGTYTDKSEIFTLDVKVAELKQGHLVYTRQPNGAVSVIGE